MCGIVGAVLSPGLTESQKTQVGNFLDALMVMSQMRGRDGSGIVLEHDGIRVGDKTVGPKLLDTNGLVLNMFEKTHSFTALGSCRAIPTTEWTGERELENQQPFSINNWSIVHNGTIANDKALRTGLHPSKVDSAVIVERLVRSERVIKTRSTILNSFTEAIYSLNGSFAVLATQKHRKNTIFFAANYKPIWYIENELGYFIASSRHVFPEYMNPLMINPYSYGTFETNCSNSTNKRKVTVHSLRNRHDKEEADKQSLVVCSGGLDSVVAAMSEHQKRYKITLLHIKYGCRAEAKEVESVIAICEKMGWNYKLMDFPFYASTDSPILNNHDCIAKKDVGAEYAHEWVPARNLVMLSLATAYAEANGFDRLVLGNNLEESGAYPDNEPEFIDRFRDLIPFAIGANKKLEVVMPVGNLVKHEIVSLGVAIKAPLDLTWSCYSGGERHCGECGPCYMRKKAFEIANHPEVIEYEN